ncbi:MAG: multidrug effflux MFS transporter [Gammaproteobacteria bacterium]
MTATPSAPPTSEPRPRLAVVLGLLGGVNPLAVDAYLPTLPTIAAEFNTDLQRVSMSLSAYFIGFAMGMLVGAPISDRRGRRPTALIGLLLYMFASLLIAFCSSIEQLLALRVLQALGAGAATVNIGAVVRDLYDERNSARMFSMVMMVVLGAPLIAPAIGSVMLAFFNWQAVFIFLTVYGAMTTGLVLRFFPETITHKEPLTPVALLKDLGGSLINVLGRPSAVFIALSGSLASSCLFIFITDSPFLYIEHFGMSTRVFPVVFGLNVITLAGFHWLNLRLLKRYPPRAIMPFGFALLMSITFATAIYTAVADAKLSVMVPAIMLTIGVQGLIQGNATAAYMAHFQRRTGIAAAISSSLQFTMGAITGIALNVFHDGSPRTMATALVTSACLAMIFGTIGLRLRARAVARDLAIASAPAKP